MAQGPTLVKIRSENGMSTIKSNLGNPENIFLNRPFFSSEVQIKQSKNDILIFIIVILNCIENLKIIISV